MKALQRETQWSEADVADFLQLSPMQARLSVGLINGATLKSYAKEWNIKLSTVKYHLRELLKIFHAKDQADLLWKLSIALA